MLKVKNLKVNYGHISALNGISFEVPDNSIVSLIGANGAGKTTTLMAISGLVDAAEGQILLDDMDITDCRPNWAYAMCRKDGTFSRSFRCTKTWWRVRSPAKNCPAQSCRTALSSSLNCSRA